MTLERLTELLHRFSSIRVAVVGDFFLDKYLDIDLSLSEPSLETGLPARQVVRVRCYPGAAGTVASNLKALGVDRVLAVCVVGRDGEGYDLLRASRLAGLETTGMLLSNSVRTPTYMKPMADGRELERLDIQNRQPLGRRLLLRLRKKLEALMPYLNGVMISDQCMNEYGVIDRSLREQLINLAQRHRAVTFLADSRARIAEFSGVSIKPNALEAERALGYSVGPKNAAHSAAILQARTNRSVFITLGPHGIAYADERGYGIVPSLPQPEQIDIVGAGDAAAAGILAALCVGASAREAAEVGNLCAGVTIRKLGITGTATPDELIRLGSSTGYLDLKNAPP